MLPEQTGKASPTQCADSQIRVLRCAVAAPLPKALDYLPPANDQACVERLQPGVRLQVPMGRRRVIAILLDIHDQPDISVDKIKPIEAIVDEKPLIDPKNLSLLQWAASYYLHPPGETLMLGLSPRERRGEPPAPYGVAGAKLSTRGLGLPEGALARAKKQAQLLALLQRRAHSFDELATLGVSRAVVRELIKKGLAENTEMVPERRWLSGPGLELNSEQKQALRPIVDSLGQFQCHLLEGVTGSGKTEIYLQAAAAVIARGEQVLLLMPEIGLTPQMVARFEQRISAPIALLHSGLSDGERERNWSMARAGHAAVVLGTRSAAFAPMKQPGLIIVDEEHDSSFSQQDGLRYSARDVAVKRAQVLGCPVLLGSATPSLESLANVERGRYHVHRLTQRAGSASAPSKEVVDIRGLALDAGLSGQLHAAVRDTLAREEQVLLFLNRRGFAPTLLCHDCGWVAQCNQCDARMTVHRRPAELRCHHCADRRALPLTCPGCSSRRLVSTGLGTEQTEDSLRRHYPNTPIHRVDSDSMTGRHAMAKLQAELDRQGPCIVLGTQMLSKGHHFPKVTLVGVIDADSLLFNPDFRGEERLAQLLTQVGGRAGRADRPGRVMIQTHHPEHPLISAVLEQPYATLAQPLLQQRSLLGLPPAGALAAMRCDSKELQQGLSFLDQVQRSANLDRQSVRLIGPISAAMARRAGLYRSQLIVQASDRRHVATAAAALNAAAQTLKNPSGLRWFMDIDPVDTL